MTLHGVEPYNADLQIFVMVMILRVRLDLWKTVNFEKEFNVQEELSWQIFESIWRLLLAFSSDSSK